jgi:Spy/CpxP family protein refolding chaperone
MKRVRKTMLLGALLSCGVAAAVTAATTTGAADTAAAPGAGHPMHFQGGPGRGMPGAMMEGPFFHAIHQLNLTAEQQTTVHGYLETARQQSRASVASQLDSTALANPGDPNYLAAITTAKNAAAARIQQQSELQVQIYGLLTPEQQAKLPQVLADMKAQHEQRRADWQQRHLQHAEPASGTP